MPRKKTLNIEDQPAAIAALLWEQQSRIAALENEKKTRSTNTIDKKKFYIIIISAIIGTAITTGFSLIGIANSDHFTIVALGQRVDSIEELLVPRGEFSQRAVFIDNRLDRIEVKIDKLLER